MTSWVRRVRAGAVYRAAAAWRIVREYRMDPVLLWAGLQRSRPVHPAGVVTDILVVRLDAIGDLVLTTPVFAELRRAYPGARITAVVSAACRDLLAGNPNVDELLSPAPMRPVRIFPRLRRSIAALAFYREHLKGRSFQIAIQPRVGPDYYAANLLLALVNAPVTIRYTDSLPRGPAAWIERFASRGMTILSAPGAQHEVFSNLAPVERATGKKAAAADPKLFLSEEDRVLGRELRARCGRGAEIVSVSFGAQAPKRTWPIERWAAVLNETAKSSATIWILCTRGDQGEANRLAAMLSRPVEVIAGASLRQVAGCLEASDLFVGPDSGLAHIAAAVGCPVVVVSPHPENGAAAHDNSPVRFRPWGERNHVLQPRVAEKPCVSACEALTPHCILGVSPEQVVDAAERLLSSVRV